MKMMIKFFFAFSYILLQDFLIDCRQFVRVTFAELPVIGDHPVELILHIRGLGDHRRRISDNLSLI